MDNTLLSIFIPTYNRSTDLDNLLHSIVVLNGSSLDNISIVVSSNNPDDVETQNVVMRWKEMHSNIYFFSNEKNIGIDANHDKVYDYCTHSKYALTIADDDLLLENGLDEVMKLCQKDFLFAICNGFFYRGNRGGV